tara:strand:- start:11 stop:136 length:126 start_codon:yes stop_codon:yes gene_type:complete
MVSLHGGGFGGDGDDIRAAREEKSLDLGGGSCGHAAKNARV